MRYVTALALSIVWIGSAGSASAQTSYRFSTLSSCIQNSGFDANYTNLSSSNSRTQSFEGTLTVGADGSGRLVARTVTLRTEAGSLAQGAQAVNTGTTRCQVRSVELSNGDLRLNLRNCGYEIEQGRAAGDTGTIEGIVFRGRLSLNGEVMQISTFTGGAIETVNSATFGVFTRVCQRTGTAMRTP